MAAASTALKLGSDVMAAVAALTVSANDGGSCCTGAAIEWAKCGCSANNRRKKNLMREAG
ncbi:unnamed protein product [Spirodela intermedia]|uniref:Uncharacterized protein n=1 Tax=Spirodela intermedia TaxID=51605 RepID=A0A7I8LEG4_SPIIN|nr:unnamed protein product [Spirodela intermedia]